MLLDEKPKGKRKTRPVREAFSISRSVEFLSEAELTKQIGYPRRLWTVAILKELLDNSLDHCEEIGRLPEIIVKVTGHSLSVCDNGDGIPPETVEAMLDFNNRVSSREAYRGITRGAQGNAGKCLVGIPYVLNGSRGKTTIISQGLRHEIAVSLNALEQTPVLDYEVRPEKYISTVSPRLITHANSAALENENRPKNTFVRIVYGDYACTLPAEESEQIALFCGRYAALNPHLTLKLRLPTGKRIWQRTADRCGKWTAAEPEPPGWHDQASFERLVGASISKDRKTGQDRLVRDFIRQFAGLKRSDYLMAVFNETGLHRAKLSSLANGSGLNHRLTKKLLNSIQGNSKTPRPDKIGCIGRGHIAAAIFPDDTSGVKYKKLLGETERGLPYVVEAAFAEVGDTCQIITGCNFSASVDQPVTRCLDGLLERQMVTRDCCVTLVLHVATVDPVYLDRGKSEIETEGVLEEAIEKCVLGVTEEYRKKRKREERDEAAHERRRRERQRRSKEPECSLKDAIRSMLPDAIHNASGGGVCDFSDRDFYYAARALIQKHTTRELSQRYFDAVVDEWEQENGLIEGRLRDPRGFLMEPHTGRVIPLGTKAVDAYEIPAHLYDTIIYVEKKGLLAKFQFGQIAERYDCAIIAAEGYAARAAKALIHAAQHGHAMRVLCFHDADPDGYNIARTLSRESGAHRYNIDVIDAGLRLEEALDMGLAVEVFERRRTLPKGLNLNGVELRNFRGEPRRYETSNGEERAKYVNCRRVELNALSSDPRAFVEWVEDKLREHGVAKKLIPPKKVIDARAKRQLREMLERRLREKILENIGVESMVHAAAERLLSAVDVSEAEKDVKRWSTKNEPEPWTACVDRSVANAINAIEAEIAKQALHSIGGSP